MTKSRLIWTLTGMAAVVPALAQERPNVVLFVVDDMGPMDTSVPFLTGQDAAYPVDFEGNPILPDPDLQ